jgi:hypothetical protein
MFSSYRNIWLLKADICAGNEVISELKFTPKVEIWGKSRKQTP